MRSQVVGLEDNEYYKVGDLSHREGEERIEILVTDPETKFKWKVVERGVWCLTNRIELARVQPGASWGEFISRH